MKLTVLGYNGPYPEAGGACSGYLLEEEETKILLDCGSGVLGQLMKYTAPEKLTAVVLSHLHFDHMSDMLPLSYRCPGLRVYAPDNPQNVRALLSGYDVQTMPEECDIGSLHMTVFPGRHPVPSFAVRLKNKAGRTFAYTGDTNTCGGMGDFLKNADLLLADGCFTKALWGENKPHLSAQLAAQLAKDANVEKLVVTHFTPGISKEDLMSEAREIYPASELAVIGKVWEI